MEEKKRQENAKVTLEVNQSHLRSKLVFCEVQAKQFVLESKLNGAVCSVPIQV